MKTKLIKRVSQWTSVLLIGSVLSPVLAFADAYFKDVSYSSGGTVTGQVYFDGTVGTAVYGDGPTVTLSVYDANGGYVTPVTATYSTFTNGKYYYNINPTVISSTYSAYNPITLRFHYDALNYTAVTDAVYKQPRTDDGGTTYYPPTTTTPTTPTTGSTVTLDSTTSGTVTASALQTAFNQSSSVEVKFRDSVTLAAAGLTDAIKIPGAKLLLTGTNGTYELLLSVLDLEHLARLTGTTVAELRLSLEIVKLEGAQAKAVTDAAAEYGATTLSAPTSFTLTAEGKDGVKVSLDSFGSTYIKRTIKLDHAPTASATVALYNPLTKALSFVPSTVKDMTATFQRPGNSIYVVINNYSSFDDLGGHWAKTEIELLASKLLNGRKVLDGTANDKFSPDTNLTRGEYAALISKALGLNIPVAATNIGFRDVDPSMWYSVYIAAANEAGLIEGYEDGTFRSSDFITREELITLTVRALKFSGVDVALPALTYKASLDQVPDLDELIWARFETSVAVAMGLVDGKGAAIRPQDEATRAEAAVILKRMLQKAGFI